MRNQHGITSREQHNVGNHLLLEHLARPIIRAPEDQETDDIWQKNMEA